MENLIDTAHPPPPGPLHWLPFKFTIRSVGSPIGGGGGANENLPDLSSFSWFFHSFSHLSPSFSWYWHLFLLSGALCTTLTPPVVTPLFTTATLGFRPHTFLIESILILGGLGHCGFLRGFGPHMTLTLFQKNSTPIRKSTLYPTIERSANFNGKGKCHSFR